MLGHYNSLIHIVNTVCKVYPEDNIKEQQKRLKRKFGNTKVVIMQYQKPSTHRFGLHVI